MDEFGKSGREEIDGGSTDLSTDSFGGPPQAPPADTPTPPKQPQARPATRPAKAKPTRRATARAISTRKSTRRVGPAPKTRQRLAVQRAFPASTFQDALVLAEAIWIHAAGERIRRVTLFDQMGKSPDSGTSRQLITNSARYGLTTGSYAAAYLELTADGKVATNPEAMASDRFRARFKLAIEQIPIFLSLYDNYKDKKIPSQAVMRDFLKEQGTPDDQIAEAIETFTLNAKYLGILRVLAGAQRIVSVEQVVEEGTSPEIEVAERRAPGEDSSHGTPSGEPTTEVKWEKVCFYVTPIGSEGSEERKHSDLFLSSLVEPAVQEFGLAVIRADQIGKPGMISSQIIEHIAKARLVIADLSFHNPNVFYELALRHARKLPVVQITRLDDPIPFDLDQFRTVQIDTSSIYTLVPRLDTYRSEIANHIRRALSEKGDVENPLTAFYPSFWDAPTQKKAASS